MDFSAVYFADDEEATLLILDPATNLGLLERARMRRKAKKFQRSKAESGSDG
jgi:hypothetical protein